jgi:two-component system, chemotaxis family, chemotaxis protein CheY
VERAVKTCLVVDDSRVIRKVARRVLEDIGFEIAEAADGMEALAWCRAAMPVMNGIEFLRHLRQEPGGEGPTVVFCTVENKIEAIREALDAGADEYIMKPFDGDIIAAKFAEAGLL